MVEHFAERRSQHFIDKAEYYLKQIVIKTDHGKFYFQNYIYYLIIYVYVIKALNYLLPNKKVGENIHCAVKYYFIISGIYLPKHCMIKS